MFCPWVLTAFNTAGYSPSCIGVERDDRKQFGCGCHANPDRRQTRRNEVVANSGTGLSLTIVLFVLYCKEAYLRAVGENLRNV